MVLVILCSTALQSFPSSLWVLPTCSLSVLLLSNVSPHSPQLYELAPHMINKVISSHNMLTRFFTFATVVQTLNFDNACSPYPYDQQSYHCCQNLVRTYHHWVVYFGVAVSYTATNTFILENISRSHETATYTKINYSTVICARRFWQ